MQTETHFGHAQRSKATAQQFRAKMRIGAREPALESGDGWVSIQWANTVVGSREVVNGFLASRFFLGVGFQRGCVRGRVDGGWRWRMAEAGYTVKVLGRGSAYYMQKCKGAVCDYKERIKR